jgi:hypothetical protein
LAGVCQEIGLIEQIDAPVKANGCKVSCDQATQAMVLNALGFTGPALYLMPDYLHHKPVDLLIDPGLTADDFNPQPSAMCFSPSKDWISYCWHTPETIPRWSILHVGCQVIDQPSDGRGSGCV